MLASLHSTTEDLSVHDSHLGRQTTGQKSGIQVQMLLAYASKQLSWELTLVILDSKHFNGSKHFLFVFLVRWRQRC